MSRRNSFKTTPFWLLPAYPLSLGRGLRTNQKDISLLFSQFPNTLSCCNAYRKLPTIVTLLAWEDHGQSCQPKVSHWASPLCIHLLLSWTGIHLLLPSQLPKHIFLLWEEKRLALTRAPSSYRSQRQPKDPRRHEKPSILCCGLVGSFPQSSWRGRDFITVPLQLHTGESFTVTETAVVLIKPTQSRPP